MWHGSLYKMPLVATARKVSAEHLHTLLPLPCGLLFAGKRIGGAIPNRKPLVQAKEGSCVTRYTLQQLSLEAEKVAKKAASEAAKRGIGEGAAVGPGPGPGPSQPQCEK